jgi:hypothetical protein
MLRKLLAAHTSYVLVSQAGLKVQFMARPRTLTDLLGFLNKSMASSFWMPPAEMMPFHNEINRIVATTS